MDVPQSEEDEVDLGFDPLDIVEHVLTAENLTFDRTEDGDLAFALTGDWKDYELWFAWRPEADCLQLCLSLDMRAPKSKRAAAYELLSMINQRIWLGHFEVWTEGGEVVFRHALSVPQGERPTLAQAASMIDAAVEAADRFYPAFDFLLKGSKSPEDAMAACMFETVGQA
ncbi:MAG: YbjN domain-containing protein [Caulobacteraceae bacterium]|nr:YbjN domain-containing protein [Caulobacteraceae bacterium]